MDQLAGVAPYGAEVLFGVIGEALGQMVFTNLPDGSCDYANQRFADYTGLPAEAARGRGWTAAVHPEDVERVTAEWEQALRAHTLFESQYRLRGADGSYRWFVVRDVPLAGPDGHVVKWFGACADVTSLREADEAHALLAAIVEGSEDAILSLAFDGLITSWNPAAERLYGYSATEAVGRPAAMLFPAERGDELREATARLQRGEHVPPFEAVALRKDGVSVTISVAISAVKDCAGVCSGAALIARDISALKRLEEQYRQSQKMEAVGVLAGGIAHDFNNLLTAINGFGELALQAIRPDEPARAMVREVVRAGERAAALTQQLLAFSRKQILAPKVLDLNAVVRETEKMLRRVIGEDIEVATELQPTLGRVHADPGQLQQVLLNLAVNARDAMPTGGKLTVETRNVYLDEHYARAHVEVKPGPHVLLAISDTGHGMTLEVQARLFEPFFTTKGQGRGTGLGLATVYGIVKQSGGHIWVYSEPGVGTTFKVYLPRVEQPVLPGKSFQGVHVAPPGTETVLLVEDDEAVRLLAQRILSASGYTVLAAGSGPEALQLCAEHKGPVDVLVTDVVMPGMGGRLLARELVRLYPRLRVLYLSGYTDDAVVRHGVLEEEVNFLQKPFQPAALAEKVREVLDARRPR